MSIFKKIFGFGKKEEIKEEIQPVQQEEIEIEEIEIEIEEEEIEIEEEEIEAIEEVEVENGSEQTEIKAEEIETQNEIEEIQVEEKEQIESTQDKEEIQSEEIQIEEEIQATEAEEFIEEVEAEVEVEEEDDSPKGFFARLKKGLTKTTQNFTSKIDELFNGYKKIDSEIYEELEEILIMADVGFETTLKIVDTLKLREKANKIEEVSDLHKELENIIEEILVPESEKHHKETHKKQKIMVVVGVNGVGKTTSIGKISSQLKKEGNTVMLAAADTFRAAATEQLSIWAQRAEVPIVKHQEGADPSAVIFDAIKSAKANNTDILICDTAGRLHNKKNLMNELGKIFKIIDREFPEAEKEVLLVIDATTGQNAINQAKVFKEVAPLSGIILTKLDGTAKGGVVLAIISELNIPIRYVGVGEKINDLQYFEAKSFAKALFGKTL